MILDELAAYAEERVKEAKEKISADLMRQKALAMPKGDFRFEKILKRPGMSFICEVKKASPSKGIIDPVFDYIETARAYEAAGADCISCLTEPKWFMGSDEIFREIRQQVILPMIRKDFTVDEYQIYEARCMGADAVLLICAILDADRLKKYLEVCEELGLSAIVETHDPEEVQMALAAGARIIGVNNRNLKDFTVDTGNTERLRKNVPEGTIFVAESGVRGTEEAAGFKAAGADAVLIGEAMMRAADKAGFLQTLREAAR